jgi:alpha-galactosidase
MRSTRLAVIGAGSKSFGLSTLHALTEEREALAGSSVVLVDVDEAKLEIVRQVAELANREFELDLSISATTSIEEAVEGASFVINSAELDYLGGWRTDFEIPIAHGVPHQYAEDGGPGGLSHALRTVPLALEFASAVEQYSPDALFINYANPMSQVSLALSRYSQLKVIGLCHQIGHAFFSVGRIMGWIDDEWGTAGARAQVREVFTFLELEACGVNHLTFIRAMRDRRTGEDLYPAFRSRLAEYDPDFEPISRHVHDIFGLYPTGGDEHISEYFPWSRFTPVVPPWELFDAKEVRVAKSLDDAVAGRITARELLDLPHMLPLDRAIGIIAAALEGRHQYELAVNVPNRGAIPGLPDWAIVEVPVVASAEAVRPIPMEPLPPAITALLNHQIAYHDLCVEAAVHRDRAVAMQALLLDSVTNHDLAKANEVLDALLAAHGIELFDTTPERLPEMRAG